jgi:hypothetical protein
MAGGAMSQLFVTTWLDYNLHVFSQYTIELRRKIIETDVLQIHPD